MRILQIRLSSSWDFRDELLRVPWDPLCQEYLLWWSWAIQQRVGVVLSLLVPDLSFYSDASDVGWGAIVGENQVSGVWTPSQRELSINLRETMAVQKGLLEFSCLLRGKTITLFCDNVTIVAYLRRSGGTRSQILFLEARGILLWVESMEITLLPQFFQGSLNTRADLLSRPILVVVSEWTLHQEVVFTCRSSSRVVYQSKWLVYRGWCRGAGHFISRPTLPKIADFLLWLHLIRKRSVSAIMGYHFMLSAVFRLKLPEISTSPVLQDV